MHGVSGCTERWCVCELLFDDRDLLWWDSNGWVLNQTLHDVMMALLSSHVESTKNF
eukprot:CAMPEP_0174762270 /NCGR_PEP_ID=MMETSP1094-20130205/109694_1 /TAXON_ID=156173 /ORGANISM="Chrysochromulina brevifilum, Strain UTEX LB 985" /LENGTH=55 /DNA_ID=CAMNT_0015968223 /DNA_START=108 /DNA_END=275 /DNA_ORIENTATION=-